MATIIIPEKVYGKLRDAAQFSVESYVLSLIVESVDPD
jgi:hypothetical protein